MTKPHQRHWKQGPDPEYVDLLDALPAITWTKGDSKLMLTSIRLNDSVRCVGWSGKKIKAAVAKCIYRHTMRWPQLPAPGFSYWRHAPTQSWVITRTA